MNHLMLLLALVVAAAAVMATPVERTNGVIGINDDELALESNQHFTAVNRGCPDCNGLFLPKPYHLIDADERRGLAKRSPKKFAFTTFKKTVVPGFNKPFKFGKKNLGKAAKPGSPQNKKAKKGGKGFGKFGKKNFAKAFKPGSPQNKKAKKGGKKTKKGGKKGGKGLGKGAKKSSPLSVPTLGGLGGGGLAFGVPGTGFAGFAVPGLSQAAFDYVAG